MNRKLLLISANQYCSPYPIYPIGISYLSTYLKTELPDFEILSFDMNFKTLEQLAIFIQEQKPDYIGVSIRNIDNSNSYDGTNSIPAYNKIIHIVRQQSSKPLIIGGAGFSIYAQTLFETFQPDFAIKGEGEKSLTDLLNCLENNLDYTKIQGLIYRDENDKIIINPRNEFARRLSVHFDPDLIGYYWDHSGMLNIQTKRGCFHKCIYCSYPLIEGTTVRCLDNDEIVENLERLQREKGINYVFFTDSLFNIANKHNVELAEKIIRRNLKISWAAYFSPSNITDEEMAIYKHSGLSHIEFGTESFSNQQLHNYGKNFTFDQVITTSEMALKHNVFYAHFLILGGYGETNETLSETFNNSKKLRYTVLFPFVGMRIYPGTILQQYAINDGIIKADDNLLEPKYYISKNFDQSTLKEKAYATGKAWIFPDDLQNDEIEKFRIKRKKKGLIWEYLRLP